MSNTSIDLFYNLYKKHQDDDVDKNPLMYLWHYTSVNGFEGIVKKDCLTFWFTRSDCLNDTSEGTHTLYLFENVCDDLLSRGEISHEFHDCIKLKNIDNFPTDQFTNYPIESTEKNCNESILDCVPCNAYICCFSKQEDSLDMWRNYFSGRDGYGLKLFSTLFGKYEDYESQPYVSNTLFSKMRYYNIVYDDSQKKKILTNLIIELYETYTKSDCTDKNTKARWFVENRLRELRFRFKHNCFSSEKECRFVYYVPCQKPQNLQNELPEIKFRRQNGLLIPYIEVKISIENASLNEVLISPYITDKNAVTVTRDYLNYCGFNCNVSHSELPVR